MSEAAARDGGRRRRHVRAVELDPPLTVELARDFGGLRRVRFAFGGDGTSVTFRPSEGAGRIDEEAVFVPRGEETRP